MIGGIGAGTLADRYGRKGLILSRSSVHGLRVPERALDELRDALHVPGLFGIGMVAWAAGRPLALEQWPAKHRGIASGILQGGYSTGFLLSSLVYQLGYPLISGNPDRAWRLMLWAGVVPAMVIFVLMTRVSESPMWLEQQRLRAGRPARLSIARMFDKDLLWVTIHTSLLMGAFVWMYQSTTIWCPTLLASLKRQPLRFRLLLNAGGMISSIVFGWLSEMGRSVAAPPRSAWSRHSLARHALFSESSGMLLLGAWLIGFCASGAWGIVRLPVGAFSTEVRGVGTGFSRITSAAASARLRHT
jgi:SHS family lactate transporter-like MFS transporter